MNILFRTDSSSVIGTGHVMRDLVLAKQFSNDKIFFATQNLPGNINHKILESNYKLLYLETNDIYELEHLIKKYNIDMIVIDNYNIDWVFEKQLKENNPKLIIFSFDDTYEMHYCDIILNHNIYAESEKYRNLVPLDCEIRCGKNYTLLRDEFYFEKNIIRNKKYDYIIIMGGADTDNLNINILKIIPKKFKIAVVTTKANNNLIELKNYIKNKKNITLFIDSNQIAKLINQSKCAIITPSVIVNEIYWLGIDFIAIKTADNQKYMVDFLKKNGYLVINKWNEKEFSEILKRQLNE